MNIHDHTLKGILKILGIERKYRGELHSALTAGLERAETIVLSLLQNQPTQAELSTNDPETIQRIYPTYNGGANIYILHPEKRA